MNNINKPIFKCFLRLLKKYDLFDHVLKEKISFNLKKFYTNDINLLCKDVFNIPFALLTGSKCRYLLDIIWLNTVIKHNIYDSNNTISGYSKSDFVHILGILPDVPDLKYLLKMIENDDVKMIKKLFTKLKETE